MASSLTIQVGGVTATRTFNIADAKVAATLRRFATARGIVAAGMSNQQLADAIAAEVTAMIRQAAIGQQVDDEQVAARAASVVAAGLENAL